MPITLGGKKARGCMIKGDLIVFFQYVNGEEAMVIAPKIGKRKKGAFIICMSAAYKYVDSNTGMPTPYLFESAARGIQSMCMEESPFLLHRLADLICECLPELVNMKPEQADTDKQKSYGEGRIAVNGSVHEFELTDPSRLN